MVEKRLDLRLAVGVDPPSFDSFFPDPAPLTGDALAAPAGEEAEAEACSGSTFGLARLEEPLFDEELPPSPSSDDPLRLSALPLLRSATSSGDDILRGKAGEFTGVEPREEDPVKTPSKQPLSFVFN
jgi:hypothetical protein